MTDPQRPEHADPRRDETPDQATPKRRKRLSMESLEDRILLSATWADADDADPSADAENDAAVIEADDAAVLDAVDAGEEGDPFAGMDVGGENSEPDASGEAVMEEAPAPIDETAADDGDAIAADAPAASAEPEAPAETALSFSAGDVSGYEDSPIALPIELDLGEGVEAGVTIANVPEGATLSAGIDNGDGTWSLTAEQAQDVSITPPADFHGEFDLSVTVNAQAPAAEPAAVMFDADEVTSFAGGQDKDSDFSVEDDGQTLHLQGNTWKDIPFEYQVTADTVLEFEFRSTSEGEAHAIGFASGDGLGGQNQSTAFKVYGTQETGYATTHGAGGNEPYDGSGEWQSFSIRAGDYFTGEFDRMTLVSDNDVRNAENDSFFRNVRVYEAGTIQAPEPIEQTAQITVSVANVADAPDIDAQYASGAEDTLIPLDIELPATGGVDADDVEIIIDGVPEGAELIVDAPPTELGVLKAPQSGSITVTFGGEDAGFRNAFGSYQIDPETGEISAADIAWTNASQQGSGGDLIAGESSFTVNTEPGKDVGFFLIANGDRANDFDALGEGRFEFRDGDGSPATLESGSPRLVHIAEDGTETVMKGRIYHSASQSEHLGLNPDGMNHVRTEPTGDGGIEFGFEDMFRGGDNDFDDIKFTMSFDDPADAPQAPDYSVERNADGSYRVGKDALPYLSIKPPADFSGQIELDITAVNTADDGPGAASNVSVTVEVTPEADAAELRAESAQGNEDEPIELNISAALSDKDGSETLSVTIAGVPEGASLSAGTDNGDGSWTVSPEQLDGLSFLPAHNSDADARLTVTATTVETATGDVEIVSKSIDVGVDAVADTPVLDTGGEHEITFTVSGDNYRGDPKMRILVNGERVGGTVTVTADHSAGEEQLVTVRGSFGPDGPQNVSVQFVNDAWGGTSDTDRNLYVDAIEVNGKRFESEGEGVTYQNRGSTMEGRERMSWQGTMTFDTSSAAEVVRSGLEDNAIPVNVSAVLTDTDGSETLAVTIANVPEGASLSAGADNGDGTWSLGADDLDGLTITPPKDFAGSIELEITATSTDGDDTASISDTVSIDVEAVADVPVLNVADSAGAEDTPIALNISAALTDIDGSETLAVTVSNVPAGASLSAGTDNGDGTWSLAPDQLDGLTITPPEHFAGTMSLDVVAVSTDGADTASAAGSFGVRVDAVADAPELTVNNAAGLEDTAVPLNIGAALVDADGSETLGVTISGVPSGASLSAGTDNGDGTWSLEPGELRGLTIRPPADFAGSFDLEVAATSTDGDDAAASQGTVTVEFAPVADAPTLTVAPASGEAGSAIPVGIAAASTDVDGSETVTITVGHVPSGATLSAGTDNGDGTWTLSQTDARGLTITPPAGFAGEMQLDITATASEGASTNTARAILSVDVSKAVAEAPQPQPQPETPSAPEAPAGNEPVAEDDGADAPPAPIDWSDVSDMAVLDPSEGIVASEDGPAFAGAAAGNAFAADAGMGDTDQTAETGGDGQPVDLPTATTGDGAGDREELAFLTFRPRVELAANTELADGEPLAEHVADATSGLPPVGGSGAETEDSGQSTGAEDRAAEDAKRGPIAASLSFLPTVWGFVRGLAGSRDDEADRNRNSAA